MSQYGYEVVHPDAGKYREAMPWRMYAEEQEALRQLDEQYAALESMRREEADMEAELSIKKQEAEEERIQRKAREDAAGLGEAKQMRYERFLRDHPGSVGMTRESGLDFDFGRFKR